ncbi:MAG TPA: Rieske (2Fe-2S) protein [Halococcus sp.]|nr:Rieske (2Fe-2S) protein [Halococcus sp.]
MTDDNTETQDQPEDGTFTEDDNGDVWYEPPEAKRRDVVKWLGGIAGGVSIGAIGLSTIFGLSDAGLAEVGGSSQLYTKGTHLVNKEGKRIGVDALPRGSGKKMLVLPELKKGKPLETKKAVTLLLRFAEKDFKKPTNIEGTAKGYVAYSMVCTHAGCLVEGRLNGHLHCPCHGSEYEAEAGAKVVGGPAPRALPQLPIGVSNNGKLLVATGPFEGRIGP